MSHNNQDPPVSFGSQKILLSGTIGKDRTTLLVMLGVPGNEPVTVSAQIPLAEAAQALARLVDELEISHAEHLAAQEARRKKRTPTRDGKKRSVKQKAGAPAVAPASLAADREAHAPAASQEIPNPTAASPAADRAPARPSGGGVAENPVETDRRPAGAPAGAADPAGEGAQETGAAGEDRKSASSAQDDFFSGMDF